MQIVVNHKVDQKTPRFDVQLIFDEIGVALDDSQYRDIISLLDMYHVYIRQRQVSAYLSYTILLTSPEVSKVQTSRILDHHRKISSPICGEGYPRRGSRAQSKVDLGIFCRAAR